MTKEMYDKCLNTNEVIFKQLPCDVQCALRGEKVQYMYPGGTWADITGPSFSPAYVYRIDPKVPRVFTRPPEPVCPDIPDGWERVTTGKVLQGDKFWSSAKKWKPCGCLIGFTVDGDRTGVYIRKVTKQATLTFGGTTKQSPMPEGYEQVIVGNVQAEDLLWHDDGVGRFCKAEHTNIGKPVRTRICVLRKPIEYSYWHQEDPLPNAIPAGCEFKAGSSWLPCKEPPSTWSVDRRWPKVEATQGPALPPKLWYSEFTADELTRAENPDKLSYECLPECVKRVLDKSPLIGSWDFYDGWKSFPNNHGVWNANGIYRLPPSILYDCDLKLCKPGPALPTQVKVEKPKDTPSRMYMDDGDVVAVLPNDTLKLLPGKWNVPGYTEPAPEAATDKPECVPCIGVTPRRKLLVEAYNAKEEQWYRMTPDAREYIKVQAQKGAPVREYMRSRVESERGWRYLPFPENHEFRTLGVYGLPMPFTAGHTELTKEEYEKALNPQRVSFMVLPARIQNIITLCYGVQRYENKAWVDVDAGGLLNDAGIYRVHPDTPHESYEEFPVVRQSNCWRCKDPYHKGQHLPRLTGALAYTGCLGIIFEKDGKETLRTSFDLAFGTPVRIRFKTKV